MYIRFPLAALAFIVAGFIFLLCFGVGSKLLTTVDEGLEKGISQLEADSQTKVNSIVDLIVSAFGIISAVFFVTGILLFFIMDSLSDEPEYYYRR